MENGNKKPCGGSSLRVIYTINKMKKLRIIFRSILRQKLNSGIILVSLSIGIACFNLILLFINRELKTDSFHAGKDRIFALKCDDPWVPGGLMYHCRFGSAEYLKANSFVEDFCRISNAGSQKIIINNEAFFDQGRIIATTDNFFCFFSYKLLTNNPETALKAQNSLVISEDLAKKYFGSGEAVGQVIKLINRDKEEEMVVTGVFRKPLENTQIVFDMVHRIGETDSRCYVRLAEGVEREEVEKIMTEHRESIPIVHMGTPGSYYLEPLKSAYFDISRGSTIEANRDRTDLWIAFIIGLIIISVATFNYLGLLNSRLQEKNKDYIIRLINGGSKFSLILDYTIENIIIIGISFVLSLFLMLEILPFFNELTGGGITKTYLYKTENLVILFVIVLFLISLSLLFILFRIRLTMDINVLKPGINQKFSGLKIPAFNIFQLASSIALIICSVVIIKQMDFISDKPIGLDKDVIEVRLPAEHSGKVTVFKDELLKKSSVGQVSVVGASPLLEHYWLLLEYEQDGVKKQYSPSGFSGDENYFSVLGIDLVEGEGFSENLAAGNKICVVNQAFAKYFSDQDLVGKKLPGMEDQIITGIVRDFHYSGLKTQIEPAFISYSGNGSHLMVKSSGNLSETRKAIAETWQKLIPDYPVNIESVGDRFEWYHRMNRNYIKLIASCSFISLLLAMIGLFAVSYQNSRHRTKEIGIRKINGADITEILVLLNRDFVKWVMIAFVIASPVAWYEMYKWLQNYAYKTEFSWWIFPLAGLITLVIAVATISLQSLRTAKENPVEALRYE
jgi:putative ABC transport system permease protein